MKVLTLLTLLLCSPVLAEDFETASPQTFRVLSVPGAIIEATPAAETFLASESGRPIHFGGQSVYSAGPLVIRFLPPVQHANVDVTPYRKGKPRWQCFLIYTATGLPYPYPMGDITKIELNYPNWVQLWAVPAPIFKISHCVVSSSEGMFLDNLVTN